MIVNNSNKGISIVICCFNSSKLLPTTLRYVASLRIPESTLCELVLVNNNSSDNTIDVAKEEWSKYETNINFKIVNELEPGLIHARKKGIQESIYEIIVFCDDDNWLNNNYLEIALETMNNNPSIGALGGEGIAVSSIKLPEWFEEVKGAYACGQQWYGTGFCTERMYLWGAGLVVRKSLIDKVFESPFRLTGRSEGKLLAGDDSEICMRIILLGYELYYNGELSYKHFMTPLRLEKSYYDKMISGFNETNIILNDYLLMIIKMKNKGIKRFWVYFKDLLILSLVKFRFIQRPKRTILNIIRIKLITKM